MQNSFKLVASGLGFAVFSAWSVSGALQQAPTPPRTVPSEPPLEQVLELDPEERSAFFNQRLQLHCNVCHSSEMIEQQRLTLAQWQAEVQKMIGWGATLPKEYSGLMADHLSRLYPPDHKAEIGLLEPEKAMSESAQTDQSQVDSKSATNPQVAEMFRSQCSNCHGTSGEGNEIGPRLTGRPILAFSQRFSEHIEQGKGRMPAFQKTIPSADTQALRRWLLGQSFSWTTE
jgi:mono/diheme cytochrome c family protein